MEKKIIGLFLCTALVASLAACGSASGDEVVVEEETEEESIDGEIDFSNFDLVDCFYEMADQIGVMTYEEAVDFMESTQFSFDTVEPSADDLGTITSEDDENGCHLWAAVYWGDSGAYTVYDVSYGNGDVEGSADDNVHTSSIKYETFVRNADEPRESIGSLDELIIFMRDDMPSLIEEYASAAAEYSDEPLEVTFDVAAETVDDGTVFTIVTNLPDGTILSLTLTGEDYTGQASVTVENGKAESSAFSKSGRLLRGDFELSVTSIYAALQPESVQAIIGPNGENLAGEYVDSSGADRQAVSTTVNFTF